MPLLWVLRDELHLHGTKYGCGAGICGTCSVMIAGKSVCSCAISAGDVVGDVTLRDVRVEQVPASELYSNWVGFGRPPYDGRVHGRPTQFTGGQTSTQDAFVKMRKAGAAARHVLTEAAAASLDVNPASLTTNNGAVVDAKGKRYSYVDVALKGAREIVGEYRAPYLAHATMEPMNATALVRGGRLDIRAGNQNPTRVVKICSELTGINYNDIRVHTTYMGGGFGRRLMSSCPLTVSVYPSAGFKAIVNDLRNVLDLRFYQDGFMPRWDFLHVQGWGHVPPF